MMTWLVGSSSEKRGMSCQGLRKSPPWTPKKVTQVKPNENRIEWNIMGSAWQWLPVWSRERSWDRRQTFDLSALLCTGRGERVGTLFILGEVRGTFYCERFGTLFTVRGERYFFMVLRWPIPQVEAQQLHTTILEGRRWEDDSLFACFQLYQKPSVKSNGIGIGI